MSDLAYQLWTSDPHPSLLASKDCKSGELVFPAVPSDSPLADAYQTVPVDAVGEVYSFTVIHPSKKSGESPYALGLVDFPGPVRIFGRLQGEARPTIGNKYAVQQDAQFGYVFSVVQA